MASIVIAGDTSGSVTLAAPAVAGTTTLTLPATSATLATLTTPSFATTIGVGGATASASGSGITFPATQSASSNANTLDDYEEGTWSPVVEGTSTNPTVSYSGDGQIGTYVKIGKYVFVTFYCNTSSQTGGSGDLVIGGLPFASSNIKAMINPIFETARAMAAGRTMIAAYTAGDTKLNLLYYGGVSTGSSTLATSGVINLYGMMFYTAAN